VFVLFLVGRHTINPMGQKEMIFPDDLSDLCPYTNFCNSSKGQFQVPESLSPCCRSCSCKNDCGLKHNCCTYEMDKYRLDERNVTSCNGAFVYHGRVVPPGVVWYHMYDTCPSGESCRTDGEHTSYGLFPHSSLTDGSIYFNRKCGECNNATNLLQWRVGYLCKQQSSFGLIPDFSSSVDNLLNGRTADKECFLRFIPPEEVKITTEECYPESRIIRDCKPNVLGHYVSEEDRANCKLFNATYQVLGSIQGRVYGNVYCAKCNDKRSNAICEDNSIVNKAPTGLVFLLLDKTDNSDSLRGAERMEFCNAVIQIYLAIFFKKPF